MHIVQTRKGLGELYGLDRRSISKALAAIGITHRGMLMPNEISLFVAKYGAAPKSYNALVSEKK